MVTKLGDRVASQGPSWQKDAPSSRLGWLQDGVPRSASSRSPTSSTGRGARPMPKPKGGTRSMARASRRVRRSIWRRMFVRSRAATGAGSPRASSARRASASSRRASAAIRTAASGSARSDSRSIDALTWLRSEASRSPSACARHGVDVKSRRTAAPTKRTPVRMTGLDGL